MGNGNTRSRRTKNIRSGLIVLDLQGCEETKEQAKKEQTMDSHE